MPKAKAKKKSAAPTEPDHDPSWERAVIGGLWDRPAPALPDAREWPTWGALRERVLTSCRTIRITHTPTLRNAFPAELVKLSPEKLTQLELRCSPNLRQFVLSPFGACPNLSRIDLSGCERLEHVLVQSNALTDLNLSNCARMKKALVHCPNLTELKSTGCDALETVMIWSAVLVAIDLSDSTKLRVLKLQCPKLTSINAHFPTDPPVAIKRAHRPIAELAAQSQI